MKRIIFLLMLGAAALSCVAFRPLPAEFDGSMSPYPLNVDEPRPWADSLTPIMVNYVGRHGARFLSSSKKVSALRHVLMQARQAGKLTADGEDMLALLARVDTATADRWGALDSLGMTEQQALARQMYSLLPQLLSQGKVSACSTYVPRVVMSMYEFCHSLCTLSPDLDITAAEGKCFSPLLRYFDTDSLYAAYLHDGAWREVYTHYENATAPTSPAKRLTGDFFGADSMRYRSLSMDIYGVLQSLRATSLPAPTTKWMSAEDYESCWRVADMGHVLRRTATTVSSLPTQAAVPLLRSIIASMDSAGTPNAPVADLRFGHAETLMPLLSLMRLPGCTAPADLDSCYRYWKDYMVVPLGANLMIVTLQAPSSARYVCIRLNGRWIKPVPGENLIVKWECLKNFWNIQM